jgi:hypothetical protein
MHVTIRRLVAAFIVAVIIEGATFAILFDDLLYLRQPPDVIAAGPVDTFERHAADALRRDKLTAQHLETMAAAARAVGRYDLEVQALERRAQQTRTDLAAKLRVADALRRAGRLGEAEQLYLDVLERAAGETR